MKITMEFTGLEKDPNTKTTYKVVESYHEVITEKQYINITKPETLKWFRKFGGSETITKGNTCRGYVPTKLVSISPCGNLKNIRKFKFE